MVSPHRVKYAGIASDELNILDLVMCAALDGDNGETNSFLNRSAVQSESHDGRYKPTVRYKYDEVFAPKFTFLKKDFCDFSMDEVRLLLKYLTSKDTTALLEVFYDDSNVVSWAAIGGWTELNLQKLANNRTIGVTAVFSAVHPFAFSDLYTVTKTISSATDNKITINIDTDDNQPVYPRVTIEEKGSVVNIPTSMVFNNILDMVDYVENTAYYNGSTYYWKTSEPVWCSASVKPNYDGWATVETTRAYTKDDAYADDTFYHYAAGNMYYWMDPYSFHSSATNPNLYTTSVKIRNTHTDFFNQKKVLEPSIVKNNNTTEKIVIDGANKITSSNMARRIFGDDFNWQWLELHDGKNEITVEGNCKVTLEWRCVRKVGEY